MIKAERVLGSCFEYESLINQYEYAIPSFVNNMARLEWIERLLSAGYKVPILCHPSIIIYLGSQIGLGSTIEPFAVINHTVLLVIKTIIGSHVVIEYEITIGTGCNIRAGAILAPRTQVSDMAVIDYGEIVKER
jgi:acetyltransferase-like isoleucine patch superfamily enzyme